MKYKSTTIFLSKRWKKFRIGYDYIFPSPRRDIMSQKSTSIISLLDVVRRRLYLKRRRVAFSWKFLPFQEELADNYRARGQPSIKELCVIS